MFETFVITFREGLEAFLIVAIILAYLKKTGRENLIKPVYSGIVVALALSATTGWHVASLAQEPIWEGSLAIISGALVASFTIYIMRTAKHIRQNIGHSLEKRAQGNDTLAEIGVFMFVILMVAREGMETALMLGTISVNVDGASMLIGGLAAVAGIGIMGYLWASQSQRINLRLFLQVTGVFLVLFSLHLFLYGLHELSEMNLIPFIGDDLNMEFHIATESLVEEGLVAEIIRLGLVVVPVLWLGISYLRDKMQRQSMQAAE